MSETTITVLVVEDEKLLLEAIVRKLKLSKIEPVPCESASQGLEYLTKTKKLPDIIWLDYYLKDMNGMEFVQEVKRNPAWRDIPIMVVSNSASEEKVQKMRALGVDKYLLKAEFRLEEIIKELKDYLYEKDNSR